MFLLLMVIVLILMFMLKELVFMSVGTYESLSVEFCTASTSPVLPDHYAETLLIINYGYTFIHTGA